MTQPDNTVPARGARPQLFGTSSKGSKPASRQPDFGPSILATIDGMPKRDTRSRDGVSLKRVLWMSAFALGLVAVYFAVKLGMMPSPAGSAASVVVAQAVPAPVVTPAPAPVVAKAAEPVVPTASAVVASVGVASIENVAAPALAPASTAAEPAAKASVAESLNNIQLALARSDAAEAPPRKADKPVAVKHVVVAEKEAPVAMRGVAASSPKPAAKSGNDNDTDLLAAMLPHLKRQGAAPTSPAYEKRCGQLRGDAAVDCRARFCTGREGVDPACPSAPVR